MSKRGDFWTKENERGKDDEIGTQTKEVEKEL